DRDADRGLGSAPRRKDKPMPMTTKVSPTRAEIDRVVEGYVAKVRGPAGNGDVQGAPSVIVRSDAQNSHLAKPAWPVMHGAAYYGFAGEVVDTIAPHSEADPVAILIQFLTCFGNVIGRAAYYQVESDRHHANLFTVLVGATSKARKG